jgi:hypothetical protein
VEKPTFASVTIEPCSCGFLEQAANDPKLPIRFDPSVGEYNFEFTIRRTWKICPDAKAQLRIYHRPFCVGAAPPSKKETLFARISDEEAARLYRMFHGMRTLEKVVRAVGPPDEDIPRGVTVRQPEKEGNAPRLRSYRTLHYTHISHSADVHVYADPADGDVHVALTGKYTGLPTG